MGKLTEKETEIELGALMLASFTAQYIDGEISKILCLIEVDGSEIKWHASEEHGLHNLLNPYVLERLEAFIKPEFYELIKNQLILGSSF